MDFEKWKTFFLQQTGKKTRKADGDKATSQLRNTPQKRLNLAGTKGIKTNTKLNSNTKRSSQQRRKTKTKNIAHQGIKRHNHTAKHTTKVTKTIFS